MAGGGVGARARRDRAARRVVGAGGAGGLGVAARGVDVVAGVGVEAGDLAGLRLVGAEPAGLRGDRGVSVGVGPGRRRQAGGLPGLVLVVTRLALVLGGARRAGDVVARVGVDAGGLSRGWLVGAR